jgi:hypothetical protein
MLNDRKEITVSQFVIGFCVLYGLKLTLKQSAILLIWLLAESHGSLFFLLIHRKQYLNQEVVCGITED